ncbi:hypothetical protein [Aerococcus vaginalis]
MIQARNAQEYDVSIQNAVKYYLSEDFDNCASLLMAVKEAYIQKNQLDIFQNRFIRELLVNGAVADALALIDALLSGTEEDIQRFESVLKGYESLICTYDVDNLENPLPEDIETILLNNDSPEIVNTGRFQSADFLDLMTMAPYLQRLSLSEQNQYLNRVKQLPSDDQQQVVEKALENPSLDFIVRSDLIADFLQFNHTDKLLTFVDYKNDRRSISTVDLLPLTNTSYYRSGVQYIGEKFENDPIAHEALLLEWGLFCAYIYPFMDEETFMSFAVIDFFHTLLIRDYRGETLDLSDDFEHLVFSIKQEIDARL